MMKRKIQIEIDVPEYIDDSFIEMLSMLDSRQLNLIKGTVIGMLLADDKLSNDDIDKKNRTLPKSVRCDRISFQEMFSVICIYISNISRFLSCVSI